MISLEGAATIAQIIPVALLIIVIERRALGVVFVAHGDIVGVVIRGGEMLLIMLVILASLLAEAVCIVAVSSSRAITEEYSPLVVVPLGALGLVTASVLVALLFSLFQDGPASSRKGDGTEVGDQGDVR